MWVNVVRAIRRKQRCNGKTVIPAFKFRLNQLWVGFNRNGQKKMPNHYSFSIAAEHIPGWMVRVYEVLIFKHSSRWDGLKKQNVRGVG